MNPSQRNIIFILATFSLMIIGSYSLPDLGRQSIENAFDKFGMKFSEIVLSTDNYQNNIACFPYGIALMLSAIATRANGRTKNDIKSILNVGTYNDDSLIFQVQSMNINIESQLRGGPSVAVNMIAAPREYWPQSVFKNNVLDILKIIWNGLNGGFIPSTSIKFNGEIQINDLTNFAYNNIQTSQTDLGKLVLGNAIHLQGRWAKPFTSITQESFYGYSRTTFVRMMRQVNVFEHGVIPELGIKFIIIPYANMEASMVIIMPTIAGSIANLGGKLQNFKYYKSLYARKEEVELQIPKFQVEIKISIRKHLEMLGLNMFTHSGIFDVVENQPVHLADAQQNVIIKVDDTIIPNTRALYSYGVERPRFIVDHPFITLIGTDNVVIASAKINNI